MGSYKLLPGWLRFACDEINRQTFRCFVPFFLLDDPRAHSAHVYISLPWHAFCTSSLSCFMYFAFLTH